MSGQIIFQSLVAILLLESPVLVFGQSNSIPAERGNAELRKALRNFEFLPESRLGRLQTPELIRHFGYPAENHKVVTKDGYILNIQRIPYGKEGPSKNPRPPIILQHGLFGSSFEWFPNYEDQILPFALVNAGYDVWIANSRGTTYARKHVILTDRQRKFWDFDLNEMGKYDMPAIIDYILLKTRERKVKYIGISMGAPIFCIMMSHDPSYNDKVSLAIFFAPAVYVQMRGQGAFFPEFWKAPPVRRVLPVIGSIFRDSLVPRLAISFSGFAARTICSIRVFAESACKELYQNMFGFRDTEISQVIAEQLPMFFGGALSSTSVRTGLHLSQFHRTGEFRTFDFGPRENLFRYNQSTSPFYSLKRVTVPVAVFWGDGDGLISPDAVKRLVSELPNCVFDGQVNATNFNHVDYHIGKDVKTLINEPVLKLLTTY